MIVGYVLTFRRVLPRCGTDITNNIDEVIVLAWIEVSWMVEAEDVVEEDMEEDKVVGVVEVEGTTMVGTGMIDPMVDLEGIMINACHLGMVMTVTVLG